MKHKMRLTFQRGDWLSVVLVCALAVIVFLACLSGKPAQPPSRVSVLVEGKLLCEFSLNADTEYRFEGKYPLTIHIADGEVWVSDAECPGGDCAHTGKVSLPAKSILCLPNRLEILISGDSDVDLTVR